jgi:hypothetical protein
MSISFCPRNLTAVLVLVVFVVVVVGLAAIWLACGGASEEAKAQRRAVRQLRRHDQERLRNAWRRDNDD